MLIDWFTVGAQILNFLILVWLLKRYLFRPVRAAIEAREKDLAVQRATVLADQERAANDRTQWQHQKELLEQQHMAFLATVREEADIERSRLLQEARQDAANSRLTRLKELQLETANYQEELIRLTRQETVAIVRKMLVDLASAELEQSLVEVFLRRLEDTSITVSPDESLDAPPAMRLRSTFPLSEFQRQAVEKKCQEQFKTKAPMTFDTTSDLGLGVELTVRSQKLAWNLDDYLASFATRLTESIDKLRPAERAAT